MSRKKSMSSRTVPASESFEARWFAPTGQTSQPLTPIGGELEPRRGWTPPPPSKGLAFLGVSLALIAMATAGTYFFFSSTAESKHAPSPISTTTITNAELPGATNAMGASPNIDPAAPSPQPAANATPAAPVAPIQTVTPKDLPTVSKDEATAPPALVKPQPVRAPAPAKVAPAPAKRVYAPARSTHPPARSTGALPDLDNAATNAGFTPAATEPAPAVEAQPTTTGNPVYAPPSSTLPSDPPLDLEMKR